MGGEGVQVERYQGRAAGLGSGHSLHGRVQPGQGLPAAADQARAHRTGLAGRQMLAPSVEHRGPIVDETALLLQPEDEIQSGQLFPMRETGRLLGFPRFQKGQQGAHARIVHMAANCRAMGLERGKGGQGPVRFVLVVRPKHIGGVVPGEVGGD